MPVYYKWSCLKEKKIETQKCFSIEVSTHPLKAEVSSVNLISSKSFMDNLHKWSSPFEELDPLLRFEQMKAEEDLNIVEIKDDITDYTRNWNKKRNFILNKFTTGEKLTIVSSFLPGGEKTLIRQVSNLNEKVKHRLEQLDDFDESSVRKTMGLSQQEFVTKIHMLDSEIKKAWETEQRVKAFKIGIQCSKLLSDINVMQFYPSKFVLISDILDNFGNLVYDRLRNKSYGDKKVINVLEIDAKLVPESAKETCQNWMFKMASIRELLPRLYMEMSLLKCYVFISKDEIKQAIERLTKVIRGIGNPLVAVYVRLYLCNVTSKLCGNDSHKYFYDNLKEFLEDYQQILHPTMKKKYGAQLLTLDQYLNLYVPAVECLLYGSLNYNKCQLSLLEELLSQCEQIENSELFLYCIVSTFDSPSIVKKSNDILNMIKKSADQMVMTHQILAALGEHLCTVDNYRHLSAESLSQTWWKIAATIKTTANFLQVLEPWIQFACSQLSTQHINIILRGTIRYMIKCGKPADDYSLQIKSVAKRMLKSIPDVEELFLMDAFMPLIELVQTSNSRTEMAKTVLSIFFERYNSAQIEDHIVIANLMRMCCIVHDAINAVTVEDESKVCAELMNKFVQAVSYQDDLEQQLNFYVECRSAFIKLDAVLITLVHAVNSVSVRGVRGGWLQRACAAYCYVTVPSLHCALARAHLYLLSGQVALLNNCIGQAEANFKSFVSLIPDIPHFIQEDGQNKPTHDRVLGFISNFLSTLLVLPDNLDSNCKAYILSGFIKTMERINWKKTDILYYSTLLRILDLLCQMTQENYAYHIDSVLSNDELYGSDEEFIESIEKYATNICQELLVVLKALGDAEETKKQHALALELFWRVIRRSQLEEGSMTSLAANLWTLSQKLQDSNNKIAKAMFAALENNNSSSCRRLVEKLNEATTTV